MSSHCREPHKSRCLFSPKVILGAHRRLSSSTSQWECNKFLLTRNTVSRACTEMLLWASSVWARHNLPVSQARTTVLQGPPVPFSPHSSRFTVTILILLVERGTWIVRPHIAQAVPDSPDLPWVSSSRKAALRNLSCVTATWIYSLNHQAPTFTFSPFISTVLIIKSTPIVAPCPGGKRPWKKTRVWLNLFIQDKSLSGINPHPFPSLKHLKIHSLSPSHDI